jgi:hypothetical protein
MFKGFNPDGINRADSFTVTAGHRVSSGNHRLIMQHGDCFGRTHFNTESATNAGLLIYDRCNRLLHVLGKNIFRRKGNQKISAEEKNACRCHSGKSFKFF